MGPSPLCPADDEAQARNVTSRSDAPERSDDAVVGGARDVVGREVELMAIERWADALALGPSAMIIEGEAGIGKTTLWREAVAAVEQAGHVVIRCRLTAAESELPYVGLGDLFADVPDDVLAALPGPQRAALDVALLRTDEGAPLQRRAVAAAVLSTLVQWSRSRPVVVAIDDLQWFDVPSSRAIQFAVRRLVREPIGFVVASRTGAAPDRLELRSALPPRATAFLAVSALNVESLDLLLRAHLGTAFLAPVLGRIHETSGGNPYFALELGRALLDPDTSTSAAEPLAVPSTLDDLLGVRIRRLPIVVRQALLAVAALAHPTVDLVSRAVGCPGSRALEGAVTADVLAVQDESVHFTHPLLASVVYTQATSEERRHIHAQLAELVTDPDERARHLGLGVERPEAHVAAAIDAAASRAARRGATETAAVLMEQAARLTPAGDIATAARRRLDAADHHIAAGETLRARALLDQCLTNEGTAGSRARALHRMGTIFLLEGDFVSAATPLQGGLQIVGEDLVLRAAIERDISYALLQSGSPLAAVHHAQAELRAAEASHQSVLVAEALDHLCMATFLSGRGLDADLLTRAIELDDQVGPAPPLDHPGPGTGRFPLAMTLKWTDRFDAARELFRSLYDEHSAQGDEAALAVVLFHLGELECWAGDWPAALQLADRCEELGARTAQNGIQRRAITLHAMVDAYCGDADIACAEARSSLEQCEAASDALGTIRSLKSLGLVKLSLEQYEPAVEYLSRGVELEGAAGYEPSALRLVPDAVEALVGVGRVDDANKLVDRLSASAGGDVPWARATCARSRGIVEAASGEVDAGRVSLKQSLDEHAHLPQPFERARTLLVAGTIERRARQKRAAREALDEARQLFAALGAQRWVNRATAELARIGGRPPRSRDLSASELRVAELVAEGRTNREIAAAMFVSDKTVEAHLTHIYRKVGVETRRQLSNWLRADKPKWLTKAE
jgi:DNA-binding CsgD family transcriptional regulator